MILLVFLSRRSLTAAVKKFDRLMRPKKMVPLLSSSWGGPD